MAKRKMGLIALLICLCLCILPCTAYAASTADALSPISIGNNCSLTVSYRYESKCFSDVEVKLYKIADVSADFQYTLSSDFASSGLVLNGIRSQAEWNVIRNTLEAKILSDSIEPFGHTKTNEQGQVHFPILKPGLYMVAAVDVVEEDFTYFFEATLISVPSLSADGSWQYNVSAVPKPDVLPNIDPDGETEFKITKLWRGDNANKRPKSIEVAIFRSTELYNIITLSKENNWSYSWLAKDDGSKWTVVERNVPTGYIATVEQRGESFALTNTFYDVGDTPDSDIKTGDSANIMLYIVLMYVSGTMLIVLGMLIKRKTR